LLGHRPLPLPGVGMVLGVPAMLSVRRLPDVLPCLPCMHAGLHAARRPSALFRSRVSRSHAARHVCPLAVSLPTLTRHGPLLSAQCVRLLMLDFM
jgi:hypothetical protein